MQALKRKLLRPLNQAFENRMACRVRGVMFFLAIRATSPYPSRTSQVELGSLGEKSLMYPPVGRNPLMALPRRKPEKEYGHGAP